MPVAYFQQLFHISFESYTGQACHPFNIFFTHFLGLLLKGISKQCTILVMLSEDPPIYLQMQKPHQHWYSDRK